MPTVADLPGHSRGWLAGTPIGTKSTVGSTGLRIDLKARGNVVFVEPRAGARGAVPLPEPADLDQYPSEDTFVGGLINKNRLVA